MRLTRPAEGALVVAVSVTPEGAVLKLTGDLDTFSVLDLTALLDAVIERGHRTVVLELSELALMDHVALTVLTSAASRLTEASGRLTLRAASPEVLSLLALAGLEGEEPAAGLGSSGTASDVEPDLPEGVASLRSLAAIPVADDAVDTALGLVVAMARATVLGADGVSITLKRQGMFSTVAATDNTVSDMDADQYGTGEGPCIDASIAGRWFHSRALETESRWPAFVPRARALGINAILSSPLTAGEAPVGALNIYSRRPDAFAEASQELAATFASEASKLLDRAGLDVTDHEISLRMHAALRTRQIIAQAQGVIMERANIPEEAAYAMLQQFSRASNLPMRDRAESVVASTARIRSGPVPEGRSHQ